MQRIEDIMRFRERARAASQVLAPPDDDDDDDASEDDGDTSAPAVPLFLTKPAADEDSSDDDEAEEAAAAADPSPPRTAAAEETAAADPSALPAADDLDSLSDGSFLRVAPAVATDPSWRLTPSEQDDAMEAAANQAARERNDRASGSLPMNKYGRGLNRMQLDVELGARALGLKRKAAEAPDDGPQAPGVATAKARRSEGRPRHAATGRGGGGMRREPKWTESYET
mmetsp:Transcript_54673/g.162535  ORF Transcript_54673/g.162535 Transcript_54673/m.162535 type:complete len:227 (+) Transcript_54673:127-807(+)